MAVVSRKLKSGIYHLFSYHFGSRRVSNSRREASYDRNNVFSKYLRVDCSKDIIEVPTYMREEVEYPLLQNLTIAREKNPYSSIIYPLFCNSDVLVKNTSDSILNHFFIDASASSNLCKVSFKENKTFYGTKGIILDENFNPILLCTLRCKKGEKVYNYFELVCHISPKVFRDSSAVINSSIIKKVIPTLLDDSKFISVPLITGFTLDKNILNNVKIEVGNFDYMFQNVPTPKVEECNNETFNKILKDNTDDIIRVLKTE